MMSRSSRNSADYFMYGMQVPVSKGPKAQRTKGPGNHTAIEVKSAKKVNAGHLKGLLALQEEKVVKNYFLVSQDPILRETQGITCLPVKEWISRLWADELF